MSFLYEALLKKDNQDSGNPQQANPMQGALATGAVFADDNKSTTPVALWVAFAVALLIIGVLAGYILGRDFTPNQVQSPIDTQSAAMPATEQSQQQTSVADAQNGAQVEKQAVIEAPEPLNSGQSTAEAVTQSDNFESSDTPTQFNVRLDDNGQVRSEVVGDIDSEQSTEVLADALPAETSYLNTESDTLPLDEVPDNLKQQFELAVQAVSEQQASGELENQSTPVATSSSLTDINALADADKAGLPDIRYQMHIYASEKIDRWVKLNDRIMTEGEEFMPGLTLLEIRQDIIVWETRFNRFTQAALEDYLAN